jgi:hypothetical protein
MFILQAADLYDQDFFFNLHTLELISYFTNLPMHS